MDPVGLLLVRRCVEMRRCIAKQPEKEKLLKRTLLAYVRKAKEEGKASDWFKPTDGGEEQGEWP